LGFSSAARAPSLFARSNLVAWCIVPFDAQRRGPEERAAMLERLGLRRLAYDWRAEHIPTFDAEVAAMRRRGLEITAWWFPAALNDEARAILACLERNQIRPQLWVTMGTEPEPDPARLAQKLDGAAATLAPLCAAAARRGCTVGLYNHLGWFGEPVNQVAILARLRAAGHTNAGIVYNFHHGHAHIATFAEQLRVMQPHLLAINLNGMVRDGDRLGKKILPLGAGEEELRMLQILSASGWRGPVGILGHTDEDAEVKLRKELDGLDRLLPQVAAAVVAQAPPPEAVRRAPPPAESAAGNRAPGEPPTSGMVPEEQQESHWTDSRWQRAEVGQWLASTLPLPGGAIARGLTIKVGREDEGSVAYDSGSGALRAAWLGGFLRFNGQRFGLLRPPQPAGTNLLAFPSTHGWPDADHRFAGFHRHGQRVVLEHRVNGARVLESPWLEWRGTPVFTRTFNVAPADRELRLALGGLPGGAQGGLAQAGTSRGLTHTLTMEKDGRRLVIAVAGVAGKLEQVLEAPVLVLPASREPRRFTVFYWSGPDEQRGRFDEIVARDEPADLAPLLAPDGGRFLARLQTRGERGADTGPFAVDTLTMPYDNPFHALMFAAGVDFTPDGAAYVCTIHGDVWQVTGIDDGLRELTWRRFATGLFQPLGLKVRDGQVFVLGRDRLTRLHDLNADGEADFYENFFDGIATSTGGHDYVTSLEKDDAGNFYYVDPRGVHRVAADGSRQETLATGFRNPNGLGARPDGGVITAAPQQGEWTPSSGLWEVRPDNVGLYGGYGGPKVREARPAGFDAPLLWLPHAVDNSSGSQVWVPPGRWGPLAGQMLHLLWGRCGMMLVLRDEGDGTAGGGARRTVTGAGAGPTTPNGLAVPLPVKFLSGPNRGSFNPRDGHLYVAGSTGWQTSAVKDGALQRVRFTGRPAALPVAWRVLPGALELTFSEPLDPATAADAGSYGLKQWNYRYAAQYGSADWSVADPEKEGRDDVPVAAAALSADGRTLTLRVAGLRPVMQFALRYNLDTAAGCPARGEVYGTIHRVP
jgi:sugar phosphate isomerase/epimerase